jgi:hypothetical protein
METAVMSITQTKRLSPVKKMPEYYPGAVSESSIRWWIFNSKTNGFESCVRRLGRKILIDLDAFEAWIDKQRD